MGYKLPDRTVVLEGFTGDFEGLEVTCTRNAPMSTYLELDALWQSDKRDEALQLFGDAILDSWNLETDEGPVSADGSCLKEQPPDFAAVIIEAWLRGVTDVPAPLEQPSTNGTVEAESPLDLGSMSKPN